MKVDFRLEAKKCRHEAVLAHYEAQECAVMGDWAGVSYWESQEFRWESKAEVWEAMLPQPDDELIYG